MKILVLNGSPRENGNTKQMIRVFQESATKNGHQVIVVDVFKKNVNDCIACEYCHGKGAGQCVQNDDMREIYAIMKETDMLVIASPIYYHGITGKIKCVIDRFYANLYPSNKTNIRKIAMFLASGSPNQYDGAEFSYRGDFTGYLGLEDMGIYTNFDKNVLSRIKELGANLIG